MDSVQDHDSMERTGFQSSTRLRLAVYAADIWEHACPMIRVVLPAQHSGIEILKGTNWIEGKLQIRLEPIKDANLVLITRDFPRWTIEYNQVVEKARSLGKFVVYELDDLLLELPQEHPDYLHYLPTNSAILQAIVEADAAIGSSPPICEYLRLFNPNTFLWENYLDDRLWKLAAPQSSKEDALVRIGYMGGRSHQTDIQLIATVLEKTLRRYLEKVQLTFWGIEPPPALAQLPNVEWIPAAFVNYEEFTRYFGGQKCDIFLAPLADNLFNRCKSHIKYLEYSALGASGIYSKIAPYERIVRHGENGFLASSIDEWEEHLNTLIMEDGLRSQMAVNAQEEIRHHWLMSDHAHLWADMLTSFTTTEHPVRTPESVLRVTKKMLSFQQALLEELTRKTAENAQLQTYSRQLAVKNQAILDIEQAAQKYQDLYQDVVSSKSWRMMERLIRLRLRLVPHGSRRERLLGSILRPAVALRRAGLQGMRKQIRLELDQPKTAKRDRPGIQRNILDSPVIHGLHLELPAISIVVIQDEQVDPVSPDEVIGWVRRQTLPQSASVVVWDRSLAEVRWIEPPVKLAGIETVDQLMGVIHQKYICVASTDLLHQEETYLETNLLVLEAGQFALSVNLRGETEFALQHLKQGRLPGNSQKPLLRMFLRKECLAGDFSLNLSAWKSDNSSLSEAARRLIQQEPHPIVGSVVVHSRSQVDQEPGFPFETLSSQPLRLLDRALLVDQVDQRQFEPAFQPLFPIHKIIPVVPGASERPTVFLIQPFLAVGGAEKIALKVMENLADRIRFVVLTFERLLPELGTTTELFRKITPFVYEIGDFLPAELNESALEYLIRRFNPQAIYIANGTPSIYEALSSLKHFHSSIRIINQVYDDREGWINRYDPTLLMYLDAHIGSNPRICQAYLKKGVPPEQVFLIENGTDPQELDPSCYDRAQIENLKLKLELPYDKKVVTFASRLNPQKRPMDFVELARRFSTDPDISFLMIGDGPLSATVDAQIQKIQTTNLYRKPFYSPISDILAITDVLVLPSEYEGMPMIVIEAQTMGKPVVATTAGNIPEILARTGGGVVVPQIGDIAGLMDGVRKMLDYPPDPAQIRKNTTAHFDWKNCSEKYLAVILGI